mmetsp:Transcript_16357/g.26655  ORF Transcript_16357/g.26655 Transcript_16357/m.26655 type:complete len:219 (+) Transcript_16357:1152-1808(+)|eukprot:CAMPEP_0203774606 /NCGR_PEP_ID=MMETSP0099_2-20121227/5464_1 /ASSEMBLY_ACC=CAM_ASM_000209 /TAXON_ID=96639 /ORGANISM=" , Strain NY0313808BC1" /LENGTH=218 /DNA_ID=CAMNT_0050672881 /DNA_START=182 /DNA_END=838 /DNA_ORIENTATION=-
MNVTREISRINDAEQRLGLSSLDGSWHRDYKDTSWVFVGNLNHKLSEGDVLCVFSQFGEIEDINLPRDPDTGKSKGFAFLKYEDWNSTILAVDNFNGVELVGRTIRVDHSRYSRPKKSKKEEDAMTEEEMARAHAPGHAYLDSSKIEIEGDYDVHQGFNVFKGPDKAREHRKKKKKKDKKKKGKKEKRKLPPSVVESAAEKRARLASLADKPVASWKG